jgi:hypothetical protein
MIGSLVTRTGERSTESQSQRGWFAIPAALAILVSAAGSVSGAAAGETVSSARPDAERQGPPYYEEGTVELFTGRPLELYRRSAVGARGLADGTLKLWVYDDPLGRPCAATVADRPPRTRNVIGGLEVAGSFRERRKLELRKARRHRFCAYLGPDAKTATDTSFKARRVKLPRLKPGRANRTVPASLRRHDFASTVIENLEQRCRRRSRNKFKCRFSSEFPGYSLEGRGRVTLKRKISYRFRVRAQGEAARLTDENEGSFPG